MLSKWNKQWQIAKEIYWWNDNFQFKKRKVVFTIRSLMNYTKYKDLENFFAQYSSYPNLLDEDHNIELMNMLLRVVYYKDSTVEERYKAITNHFTILQSLFKDEQIHQLYHHEKGLSIYKNDELDIEYKLHFSRAQIKEGLLTLFLFYQGRRVYHINFRFDYNEMQQIAIQIGTIQGVVDDLSTHKKLTKLFFGYRPKNLIMHGLRALAQALGIPKIYCVSDHGFYANSHALRFNRSKQVLFDGFLQEIGGFERADKRFFEIPVIEPRKTYEEMKTHKRNLYRKRYHLLDTITDAINKTFTLS